MTTLRIALNQAKNIGGAWIAIAVIFAALIGAAPGQALVSARFTLESLVGIAPFLLLAIFTAAYAKASGADNLIAQAFRGRMTTQILVAALFGAVSPFCSCGVIPIIAALLTIGVPLPPVMAFWLASPLMDPSMFVMTVGTLGTGFAIAKTSFAFLIGVGGGFGILALSGHAFFANPLRDSIGGGGCAGSVVRKPQPVVWKFWPDAGRRGKFIDAGLSQMLFLGKWLTLAFLLESLMIAYMPAATFSGWLGGDGPATVILAALVGIPAYLNGYAALPLIGGLIDSGMAPGAGMAFLIAGGVTSIPAAMAVWALARWPVFLSYLVFALGGAVLTGLVFGMIA